MKNKISRRSVLSLLLRYTLPVLAALLLLLCGCAAENDLPVQEPSPSPQELAQLHAQRMEELDQRLNADIPSVYLGASSSDAVSSADVISPADVVSSVDVISPTDAADTADTDLIRPVMAAMLDENYGICLAIAGEERGEAVTAEYSALQAELAGCTDISALRILLGQMDSRLFSAAAIDPAAEPGRFAVELYGYTDTDGELWACAYTNTALPGFEDAKRGYSLTVLLDNGKAAAAAVDSIHSRDGIRYINEYAVRFRLRDVLSEQCTVDELLTGSSRVIFSLYSLDNSFTCSNEHYKWRITRTLEADPLAARQALVQILDDFQQ